MPAAVGAHDRGRLAEPVNVPQAEAALEKIAGDGLQHTSQLSLPPAARVDEPADRVVAGARDTDVVGEAAHGAPGRRHRRTPLVEGEHRRHETHIDTWRRGRHGISIARRVSRPWIDFVPPVAQVAAL
jgi:hypothetical protein